MRSLFFRFLPEEGKILCTQAISSLTSEGPSLVAREYQGQRARIRHSLLAIANYSNSWQINTWTEDFFTDACSSFGGRSRHSLTFIVRRSQSTVLILLWPVCCFLHNVVEEPLTDFRLFRALWSRSIAMFWKAKTSFFLIKKYRFPSSSNMELAWTQNASWCKIFYLKMNRNISRGLNMLTQLRSYEPPKWASSLKDIPQFFVQVSNFDIKVIKP